MCMYLECFHPKFHHDSIIEALMMALIAIRGNSITILIYNFCNTIPSYVTTWIGMQIIYFRKFCLPVSTRTLKGDNLLKVPSDSISGGVIFQNFLGRQAPGLP